MKESSDIFSIAQARFRFAIRSKFVRPEHRHAMSKPSKSWCAGDMRGKAKNRRMEKIVWNWVGDWENMVVWCCPKILNLMILGLIDHVELAYDGDRWREKFNVIGYKRLAPNSLSLSPSLSVSVSVSVSVSLSLSLWLVQQGAVIAGMPREGCRKEKSTMMFNSQGRHRKLLR